MSSPRATPNRSPVWRLLAIIPGLAAMTAVGLVACGGGGTDTGPGAGPAAAAAKLDATNYKAASSTVVDAGFGLADLDANSLADTNAKPAAMRSALKAFEGLRTAAKGGVHSSAKGGAWGGTTDTTTNCSGGGSIRIEANIARPSASSAGDRVAITYDNCIDLFARTETDGKLEFVLTYAGLGDYFRDPAYDVRVTYTFTQLRTVDRIGTSVVDGSFELESVRTAVHQGHDSFAAPRLESSVTPLTGPRSWSTVNGFLARNDYTTGTTTTTLDGTVAGSDGLNEGSVVVDTTTPFVRAIGHYPHVGVLTVTGDQGTKAEVRAIDDTTVRLSLDSNGDGTWDAAEDVAWITLW
jgi:hypothetical protein